MLQSVIKKRAEKRGLPYELEAKDDEDEETRTKRIKETEKKRPVMTKGYLVRMQVRDQVVCNEIQLLQYESDVLKAQVRQYRTKCRKMKRLAFAAIDRDDHLHETANVNMERGHLPRGPTKSDDEDDEKQNKVKYSNSKACDSELDCEDSDE